MLEGALLILLNPSFTSIALRAERSRYLSKLTFTPEQINVLKENPYIKNVSEKSIMYSDEFKRHFVSESLDSKTAEQIFFEAGFDPEMLGESRIKAFAKKWRKRYRDQGVLALKDTRKRRS